MKPVVLVVRENDGKIRLTKEELDKLLTDAYEQGRADAQNVYRWYPYVSTTGVCNTVSTPLCTPTRDSVTLNVDSAIADTVATCNSEGFLDRYKVVDEKVDE